MDLFSFFRYEDGQSDKKDEDHRDLTVGNIFKQMFNRHTANTTTLTALLVKIQVISYGKFELWSLAELAKLWLIKFIVCFILIVFWSCCFTGIINGFSDKIEEGNIPVILLLTIIAIIMVLTLVSIKMQPVTKTTLSFSVSKKDYASMVVTNLPPCQLEIFPPPSLVACRWCKYITVVVTKRRRRV